jgi:hypothetical protein
MTDIDPPHRKLSFVELLRYGFFFGLGLSVAAWAAYGAAYVLWPKEACTDSKGAKSSASRYADLDAVPVTEVSDVEERKSGDQTYFTGVLKNTGQTPIRSSQIQVDLFKGGKFVDQYTSYLAGSTQPGESRYFKISCDCRDAKVAEHDSYKVRFVAGF